MTAIIVSIHESDAIGVGYNPNKQLTFMLLSNQDKQALV